MKQTSGSNLNSSVSLCTAVCDVSYNSALSTERIYKASLLKWHFCYILLFSLYRIIFRDKFCLFMHIDWKAETRSKWLQSGWLKLLGIPVLGLGWSFQLCPVCMSWWDPGVYYSPLLVPSLPLKSYQEHGQKEISKE